jgi:hypothetical protein
MAISQVSKGVYIVSPEKADTSGSRYVSLFTKQREEQWQLAQKQAALEADIATKTYTEQLRLYRDRIDKMNDQVRDLTKMRERIQSGELSATDRATLESWRLQARRDVELASKDKLSTSTTTTTGAGGRGGGRGGKGPTLGDVSSDQEAEINAALAEAAGDPATAAAAVKARRDSKSLGSATPEDTDAQNYKVVNDLADMRVGSTGEDIDTATDNILLELSKTDPQYAASHARVEAKRAEIESGVGGGTPTTTTTRTSGQYRVEKYPGLGETPQAGPVIPVTDRDKLLAELEARRAGIEAELKGQVAPKFEGFDYITRARQIAAGRFGPTTPVPAYGQRNALQALMGADPAMQKAIIDQYRASLPAEPVVGGAPATVPPTAPGATPTAATAADLESRWAKVGVVRPETGDKAKDDAAYQAAKDAWTKANAGATTPPVTIPDTEDFYSPFTMAPGQSAESLMAEAVDVGAYAAAPGLTPGAKSALQQQADRKFKEAERRMAEESRIGAEIAASARPFQVPFEQRGGETVPFFRKPGGPADVRAMEEYAAGKRDVQGRQAPPMGTYPMATEPPAASSVASPPAAPVTPLAPAESVPEAGPVPPTNIRPEAAALMTPAEIADFKRRLEDRAAMTALMADQKVAMADATGPSDVFRKATFQEFTPPSEPTVRYRPQMTPPPGIVASLGDIRIPSGAVAPSTPGAVGRYTPGPVPPATPMAGPSSALAAPRTAAAAPEGYLSRPRRPLAANMGAELAMRGAAESAEATAAAKKQMADIKAVGAQDYFRGPKPTKVETKETYLFNRLQSAYPLAKKSDKLDRVIASGPGKVAYDLYVANKAKGVPFTKTYEEITMTFSGDRKSMEQAHNVALALDIKDSNTAPGGK